MQRIRIVGICGRKRHGKDTVGRILQDYGYLTTAFADPVKRVAMDVYGLSWDQCYGEGPDKESVDPRWGLSPRAIMQRLGTEVGRVIHPDTWIRHTLDNVRSAAAGTGFTLRDDDGRRFVRAHGVASRWAVTDVRFPNEADAVVAAGGVIVKVVRPSLGDAPDLHPSETSVDQVRADFTIINDGTIDDLRARVADAVGFDA